MPVYQHPHNQTPPDPPDQCELGIFPVAVVPYALGALESRTYKYSWSDDGYYRGVQLIRSLQLAILCGGLKEITDRQDALYRMLAGGIYGTLYTVESTDPLVVTPEIGPTHDLVVDANDSLLGRIDDVQQVLKNSINGTITDNYTDPRGLKQILEDILANSGESNDLDEEEIAKLIQIIAALA